jgi:hypothetical protein
MPAEVACLVKTSPRGQHASPKENKPNQHTLPTATPPFERLAPMSKRTTKTRIGEEDNTVAASRAAPATANVLVVIVVSQGVDPALPSATG